MAVPIRSAAVSDLLMFSRLCPSKRETTGNSDPGSARCPHPGTDVHSNDWREFLAHMTVAANDGDIERARGVMSGEELGFGRARSGFGTPGSAPSEDGET